MTLDDFCSRISYSIGLKNSAGTERTLMEAWVNEGGEQFLLETQCYVSVVDITLTSGVGDYVLDSSILAIREVWVEQSDGLKYPIEPLDESDIISLRQGIGSVPVRWYALAGGNRMMLYPDPQTGDILHVTYVPRMAKLVNGNDTFTFIPLEYHPVIEEYAKWKAADADDDTTSQVGQTYQQNWLRELTRAKKNLRRKAGRRRPRGVPIARKRASVYVRVRPDQDVR